MYPAVRSSCRSNNMPFGPSASRKTVIYLDRCLFGVASWILSALAVDLLIWLTAWLGFEALGRLERRIYTLLEEEARGEGAVRY